jgi:hypothetical protein
MFVKITQKERDDRWGVIVHECINAYISHDLVDSKEVTEVYMTCLNGEHETSRFSKERIDNNEVHCYLMNNNGSTIDTIF